jgi:ABC-type Fe3+-siderophore transport system permease subunit
VIAGAEATPAPEVDQSLVDAVQSSLIAGLLIFFLITLIIGIIAFTILRSAKYPFPSSIIMSLTILAALSLIGYSVGGESRPELAAIAGTAVGALAGGVTALLSQRKIDGPQEEE